MTDEELDTLWDVINLLDDGMEKSQEQREAFGPLHKAAQAALGLLTGLVHDD